MAIRKIPSPLDGGTGSIRLYTLQRSYETLLPYSEGNTEASSLQGPAATPVATRVRSVESTTTSEVDNEQAAADLERQEDEIKSARKQRRLAIILELLIYAYSLWFIAMFFLWKVVDSKPYEWRAHQPFLTTYVDLINRCTTFFLAIFIWLVGTGGDALMPARRKADKRTRDAWFLLRFYIIFEILCVALAVRAALMQEG